MLPRQNSYKAIADIYDLWYREEPLAYTEWLFHKLQPEIHSAERITDLACGTGTLALAAAKLGKKVCGVDISSEMLGKARSKAKREGLDVCWIEARMQQFQVPEAQDLVVCAFDSINHLLSIEALRHCFVSVYRALSNEGRFIFDVNNLRAFQILWNHDEEDAINDIHIHMHSHFDPDRRHARCTLTITRRGRKPQVQVIDERYFAASEIDVALVQAGLRVRRREPISPFAEFGAIKDLWYCRRD
ncbi:MAG TPA: class I SAM-dependent methyltransferase [Acidobacteriota bacterium]|jgi:SAM-dependent methyltransferase